MLPCVISRRGSVLAGVLAMVSGCTCQGKGHTGPGAAAHVDAPARVDAPAKVEPTEPEPAQRLQPEKGRFDAERTGFVKAKLGEQSVEFTLLPPKHNRVLLDGKPSLLIVDGYAAEDGEQHLRIHIQGVAFERMKGRPIVRTADKAWLVAVTYQDAQGKTYVGRMGREEGLRVDIVDVDPRAQLVTGTFSGRLREREGDAVLEVSQGSFKTARAG
jgi:hypothetical protein